MAVRKSGEALVYKRTLVPKINEVDPTDNPSFGDMWIDISVNPPVVKVLDSLLNPVAITTALTPPVVITGTNPATIPLTLIPATAQSTSIFVIQKVPGGGAASDILTVASTGSITISTIGATPALTLTSGIGGALSVNQNATAQKAVNIAFANPNTGITLANTAWAVNDDLLSDRAGLIVARGNATPTIQLRMLRYATQGTALANSLILCMQEDGATSTFGVVGDGNVILASGTAPPTVGAAQIGLGSTTAATASAGGGQAALATVAGYWIVNIAGTARKIPFFAT